MPGHTPEPRNRYIRAPGHLLLSHGACPGTLAIGGPGHMTNPIASPDADDITEFSDALASCSRNVRWDDNQCLWFSLPWLCEDWLT